MRVSQTFIFSLILNIIISIVYSNSENTDNTANIEINDSVNNDKNKLENDDEYSIINNSTNDKPNIKKVKQHWFYLSSEHFLSPKNDFKNPRESLDIKAEKTSHLNLSQEMKENPRIADVALLQDVLAKDNPYYDIELVHNLQISATNTYGKYKVLDKLKDFFNDISKKNKVLWISGVCNKNAEFEFVNENLSDLQSISYNEIRSLWLKRRQSDIKTNLLILIDCVHGGVWVKKCNQEYDYKDFAIQSSSSNEEKAYDIINGPSLFINNFIHAQKVFNHTFTQTLLKSVEEMKRETETNPVIHDPFQEKRDEEDKKVNNLDTSISNDGWRLIHSYQQTPSSCGMHFNIAEIYNLNTMFNSWDELARNENYFKVKNYTDINSIYVGEFYKGLPNGKGALYHYGINEKYLGEFSHNEKQGRGIHYFNDTNIYEGFWRKNYKSKGVLIGGEGDWYAGEFKDEAFNGKGKYYSRSNKTEYEGEFLNGVKSGYGKMSYDYGAVYEGEFFDNVMNGKVKIFMNGTFISEANYKNDVRNGLGWFLLKEGHNYTGNFVNGKASGDGKMVFKSGDVYTGPFVNGVPSGKGKIHYKSTNSIYEGDVYNAIREGKGKLTMPNGDIYEGDFKNDRLTGKGVMFYDKGIYRGDFVDGKFHGKGTIHLKNGARYEGEFRDNRIFKDDSDL